MATQVLGEFPCEWEDCDALLNSLRALFKHIKQHLEREAQSTGKEVQLLSALMFSKAHFCNRK